MYIFFPRISSFLNTSFINICVCIIKKRIHVVDKDTRAPSIQLTNTDTTRHTPREKQDQKLKEQNLSIITTY